MIPSCPSGSPPRPIAPSVSAPSGACRAPVTVTSPAGAAGTPAAVARFASPGSQPRTTGRTAAPSPVRSGVST